MKKSGMGFSRRQFLQVGASAGVGFMAPAAGAAPAQTVTRGGQSAAPLQPSTPAWARDLIIYEIATKGFTSPQGPESGTFNGIKARLPYLHELGINGIWLTGYALCDAHHFYNIWTQYAVIEPDQIDASLGTEADFKDLIAEAHRQGIKVFLDVITHGLMPASSVVKRHPEWFVGGTWGMTDFDWFGGHTDLDDWWVKIWTDYVVKYGADGFRLDVEIYRPDLWERIRQNAAAAGHPIAIFEENDAPIPGVTDFTQHENLIMAGSSLPVHTLHDGLTQDVPGFFLCKFGKAGKYEVEVQCYDGSRLKGNTDGGGALRVQFRGLTEDKTTRRRNVFFLPQPDGIPDVQLTIDGAARPFQNIVVTDDLDGRWEMRDSSAHHVFVAGEDPFLGSLGSQGRGPKLEIYVATLGHGFPSVQLSCHDNGWEGYPLDQNPYVAQGSRATFGYSVLFAGMIPIFFSGEEFNATFRPLPDLSPHLYGGKDAGKGRWLYGAMLDWNEVDEPAHRAMFDDVKAMIAVRKREAEVLTVKPEKEQPNLAAVPCDSDIPVPVPYVRWNTHAAIVVAANRNASRDAQLTLRLPLAETGMAGHASYKITPLWPQAESKVYPAQALDRFACTVKRDLSPGGGLGVFKVERNA
jgi:hypothetical protein